MGNKVRLQLQEPLLGEPLSSRENKKLGSEERTNRFREWPELRRY